MVSKNVITGALVFSLLSFLLPLSNFLLLPIYTQYFPPEEFGVLAIMTTFSNLIASVGGFRIAAALTPYYFEYKDAPDKFNHLYGNIIQFTILVGILTFFLGVLAGTPLFRLMFKNDQNISFYPLGILAISIGLFYTLKSPYLVRARIEKKVTKYAIFFCINTFITIGLQLLLIIRYEAGILGVLLARLASEAICGLIILYDTFPLIKLKIKKEFIVQSLRFSIPMIPSGFVGWIYAFGDRFFLERYVGLESLGIYSMLVTITGLVTMVSDAVMSGIQPYVFDHYSNGIENNKSGINNIFRLYVHCILLFCSALIVLGCNLSLLNVSREYTSVYQYVSIGVLVFLIEAYYKIYFNNLMFIKKSQTILYLSIGSVLLAFTLYFIFIPAFGIWGAVMSNIVSNSLMLIITYYISQKELYIPLRFDQFFLIPFIIVMIFITSHMLIQSGYIDYHIVGGLQFLVALFILIGANGRMIASFRKK